MMMILIKWFISGFAVIFTTYLVPGITVNGLLTALIVAVVIGLFNAVLKPLLMVLTLPINIFTLGLFTLVINGLMLWLASAVVPGFIIKDFGSAVLGAVVLWIVSWAASTLFGRYGG